MQLMQRRGFLKAVAGAGAVLGITGLVPSVFAQVPRDKDGRQLGGNVLPDDACPILLQYFATFAPAQ